MMKIHTTQNLNSLRDKKSTNVNVPQQEFSASRMREKNFGNMTMSKSNAMSMISFESKKKINNKNAKKIVDEVVKKLGDIKDKAQPEVKKGDKLLLSSFFDGLLKIADYETVAQAAIAAVICIILRPLTIIALPTKKSDNKKDSKTNTNEEKKVAVQEVKPAVAFKGNRIAKNNLSFKGHLHSNKPEDSIQNEEKNNEIAFKALFKTQKNGERSPEKTNNIYAASHSMASGLVGLITAFVLTAPFKLGEEHVMKKMRKFLSKDTLKRLYPHLNLESITKEGKRVDEKFWKNRFDGRSFSDKIDDCEKLPGFKQLAELSKETYEKVLGLNIDFAAQKGKSFNDVKVLTKEGEKSLYEVIDFSKLGIKVKEDGFKDAQILLMDLDKEYFELLAKDSEGFFKDLDIKSVFDEKGFVKDFREWKNVVTGEQWKLDLDKVFVSSPLETADYQLRISGKKRFDQKEGWKFVTYQKNGENGRLGSEINNEMLDADKNNAALKKGLTWLPDLAFRVPVAIGTIALIPWILKNVFGIEKNKPQPAPAPAANASFKGKNNQKATEEIAKDSIVTNVSFKGKNPQKISEKSSNKNPFGSNVSFKAGKPKVKSSWFDKFTDKLGEIMANVCAKHLIESEKVAKISAKLAKLPGDITQHMMTLGSLMMSTVYVVRTLSNKDMEDDRKKTLAINQILCFFIPTVAAYTVDNAIRKFVKNIKYRYTGLKEREIAMAKFNNQSTEHLTKALGNKIKGVSILSRLATFTLIYRYLTPVLVTPVANKLGDKYNARQKAKKGIA